MVVNSVAVQIWGLTAGYLSWDEKSRCAVFAYDDNFLTKGLDIAPLEKSIHSVNVLVPMYGNKEKRYAGLPRFIADSLPDQWGNKVFDAWASKNNIPKRQLTPLDRLSFMGSRGMGALEFVPAQLPNDASKALSAQDLVRTALSLQDERRQIVAHIDSDLLLEDMYRVGTSAGGKRAKAIIAMNEAGDIRSGQVELPEEYKYYILKINDADFPFPEVEMAYYMMAKDAGIEMMPSRLLSVDGKYHFLAERFDRQNGEKRHMLTLAAMSDMADSYEDIFTVMRLLKLPKARHEQMYKRLVMNILGGNVDDHSKNFSFIMASDGTWDLAPAYDLLFSIDVDAPDYVNQHSLSVCGKTSDITIDDLLSFARMNDIRQAEILIQQVQSVLSSWHEYAKQAHVPDRWIEKIAEYL